MQYSHKTFQKSLFSFEILGIKLPSDHELVRMNQEIDWEKMVEIVSKCFSNKTGRNSKSIRMMIGLEIAKKKYGLSDIAIIEELKVNLALKVFCGFDGFDHETPEASTLCRFRSKLSCEILAQLEEVNIQKMIRKIPARKRYQIITDSTCIEGNISFPTDTKILTKTWEKLTETIQKVRENGKELVIRGKQTIKKLIRSFNFKRNKTKNEILKMNKKMIREVKKLKILDGIQYRGKIPKNAKIPPPRVGKRMYCQRSVVEGKLGTLKTAYGGAKNLYKNENAGAWISFGMIAMNATWAIKH